jgi:hypothetical protein
MTRPFILDNPLFMAGFRGAAETGRTVGSGGKASKMT